MEMFNRLTNYIMSFFDDKNEVNQQKMNMNKNDKNEPPKKRRTKEISRRMQSMKDSQGISDFSGSGYNGPGEVDREKRNSNMSQRNF